jgi:predicted amidohydrolase
MSRLFGIAGVQMSVVRWDADLTFEKMADITTNIQKQFPWVSMIVFHELVVPGLVQFVTPEHKDWWKKNSGSVPGPQTDRLCELARKTGKWLIPGSMCEIDGDEMYNTSVVI